MSSLKTYLLKNAVIIDVEKGSHYKGSIEIENGLIKNIYTRDDELAEGVEVIDVAGKFIIPGLFDMHCHIQEGYAPQFVASGITTVRNTAGNVLQLNKLIQAPKDAPTPNVYSADRMIDGPPGLWGPTSSGNFVTDDPELAKKEVERQVKAGVKFIKVYGWLSKEVIEAVVAEAGKYSLEVSCDLIHSSQIDALEAAKIGVKWFEHASGFIQSLYPNWHMRADQDEWRRINWTQPNRARIQELCEQMLQYDVKLCPTMIIHDQVDKLPNYWYPKNEVTKTLEGKAGLVEHWTTMSKQSDTLKEQFGIQNKFIKVITKTYFDMGGTVVAGTDTPALVWTLPGMALHRELELFVEIGFTEMEALQTATIDAAKSIGLDATGTIKEGKIADLLILNKNPLENITYTREICTIIKGGRMFSQNEVLSYIPSKEYVMTQHAKFEAEFNEIMSSIK